MLAEKYRPKRLNEIVGQEYAKMILSALIQRYKLTGEPLPHLMFYGPAGTGKTTTAYALANELGWEIVEFNASDERGIDVVRNKIKTLSRTTGKRIIFLDEADHMTIDAQASLRRIMEEASQLAEQSQGKTINVFVLACNYRHKIIPPIRSRTLMIPFRRLKKDEIRSYLIRVVVSEGVKVTTKEEIRGLARILNSIIAVSRGDMRLIMNMLDGLIPVMKFKGITEELVRQFAMEDYADKIFKLLLKHDLTTATRVVADALIEGKLEPHLFLANLTEIFTSYLENFKSQLSNEAKVAIATALTFIAETEGRLIEGGEPYIQLSGLLAKIYIVMSYLPRNVIEVEIK